MISFRMLPRLPDLELFLDFFWIFVLFSLKTDILPIAEKYLIFGLSKMEEHLKALGMMCRICGEIVGSSKNRSRLDRFRAELLAIYNINLEDEHGDSIHPAIMCNKCRHQLHRSYQAMQQGKQYKGKLAHLQLFEEHSPSCHVCDAHAAHNSSLLPEFKPPVPPPPPPPPPPPCPPVSSTPVSGPTVATATKELFANKNPGPGTSSSGKKLIWNVKSSLKDVRRDWARKRSYEATSFISDFCDRQKEEKNDLLFFLLTESLQETNDPRYKEVMAAWNDEKITLSVDNCLAMRVTTMTSKTRYKEQYDTLKSSGVDILKPPHQLTECEKSYMPGSVRFRMGEDTDYTHHTPVKEGRQVEYGAVSYEPVDLTSPHSPSVEHPFPNIKGVAWPYAHALAKTLEELDYDITKGMQKVGLNPEDGYDIMTTVKDGADGMGDISVFREARDRLLPDKAFRASFAVLKCEVALGDERLTVYEPDKPESIFITRPLVEAIADENNRSSSILLLEGIERERATLRKSGLSVNIGNTWRRHKLRFYNTMIDEKLDRADGGLQGSGSKFVCTLCHATRESAKTELGSFSISRTFEETDATANYMLINPDDLSTTQLAEMSQGVKSRPILLSDPREKLMDATHADINMGSFFKKLITCEIARIQTWEIRQDVKECFEKAEKELDDHLLTTLGLGPCLMMPGNFARALFTNSDIVLQKIENEERREKLREVLALFSRLRSVYRAHHPKSDEVKVYKTNAVYMGELLKTHFTYVSWPNYLHKVIEHVQEILEDPSGPQTVGGLSGEGNEASNKLFRDLRRHYARKHDVTQSLRDILWVHWLFTSPKIRRLSSHSTRKYQCSKCRGLGHNARSCPSKDA